MLFLCALPDEFSAAFFNIFPGTGSHAKLLQRCGGVLRLAVRHRLARPAVECVHTDEDRTRRNVEKLTQLF